MYASKYKGTVWDWNYYVMKHLPFVFMVVTICAGILLLVTPFVMNKIFPEVSESGQYASQKNATIALKRWFSAPAAEFEDVFGMRKSTEDQGVVSRFSFKTDRKTVERFIKSRSLFQQPLTPKILSEKFIDYSIPWWKPEGLTRKTYFIGSHQGYDIRLIYNAEMKQGALQISNFK